MKKIIALLLSVCMLAVMLAGCGTQGAKSTSSEAAGSAAASDEIALAFLLKNKSGLDMQSCYVYPTGASDKGDSIITEVWPNNEDESQYKRIIIARPAADTYDVECAFTDGSSCVYKEMRLKFNNEVSLKEEGKGEAKKSSSIVFSEEEFKAAGVTAKLATDSVGAASGQTTLGFLFKNKTGMTATAAYVYPSGASDKGENILTEAWPTNATEADYRWYKIDRPDAEIYEIYVEFEGGKSLTYPALDLKYNNSASMKDDQGTMTLKNNSDIGPDGPEAAAATPAEDKYDPNAKEAKLEFLFKNKTGDDIKEAYVYPMGASDKGENLLSGVWKNNEKDSDYLELSLTRANSKTYGITVVFVDGMQIDYKDCDLINNNSVSMKDKSGAIFIKVD